MTLDPAQMNEVHAAGVAEMDLCSRPDCYHPAMMLCALCGEQFCGDCIDKGQGLCPWCLEEAR